jgi:hypothetical protein
MDLLQQQGYAYLPFPSGEDITRRALVLVEGREGNALGGTPPHMDACGATNVLLGIQDDMYAEDHVYAIWLFFAPEHAAETLTAYYKMIGAML